ncbi:hypothetical protein C8J56DRAFT_800276 [Mycena floridula]|nr:hypothetical protein C8J56DRAFT_800276 [Mycena floridula]
MAKISQFHRGDVRPWLVLEEWKKIAVTVVERFTLNKQQKVAFLLKVDARMQSALHPDPDRRPFRLIIGGPGGTGKSHIFDAIKVFYDEVGLLHELTFTAPTGVSASNIHGSTIHSELSLRTNTATLLKPNSHVLKDPNTRLEHTQTLVVDEYFFLGCQD